MEQGLEK